MKQRLAAQCQAVQLRMADAYGAYVDLESRYFKASRLGERAVDELQRANAVRSGSAVNATLVASHATGPLFDVTDDDAPRRISTGGRKKQVSRAVTRRRDMRAQQSNLAAQQRHAKATEYKAKRHLNWAEKRLVQLRDDCLESLREYREAGYKLRQMELQLNNFDMRNVSIQRMVQLAGISSEYADRLLVSWKSNGYVHLYFGGLESPDGIGHGHYVLNADHQLVYARDPFKPRGAHNRRAVA